VAAWLRITPEGTFIRYSWCEHIKNGDSSLDYQINRGHTDFKLYQTTSALVFERSKSQKEPAGFRVSRCQQHRGPFNLYQCAYHT